MDLIRDLLLHIGRDLIFHGQHAITPDILSEIKNLLPHLDGLRVARSRGKSAPAAAGQHSVHRRFRRGEPHRLFVGSRYPAEFQPSALLCPGEEALQEKRFFLHSLVMVAPSTSPRTLPERLVLPPKLRFHSPHRGGLPSHRLGHLIRV